MTYYFFLNCKHNCPFEEENVEINLLLTYGLASKKFFSAPKHLELVFQLLVRPNIPYLLYSSFPLCSPDVASACL